MSASITSSNQQSFPVPRTVLVTGGAGFVGSHLCRTLLRQGYSVYVVDNLITGRVRNIASLMGNDCFHFLEIDITQPEFRDRFSTIPLHAIYHLACPTGVPNILRLPLEMMLTCSVGTYHVLEVARKHHARVLLTSSCEVYGQPEIFPQREDYNGNVPPMGERSPYEEGKRFSETLVATYVRKFGLDAKIVRIFNTFGPAMSPDDQRVMPRFLRNICREEPLVLYGDGMQTRTFLYVDDLVRGLQIALERGESGDVYNIGSTQQTTIRDLAALMARLMGHTMGITFVPHFIEDHSSRQPVTDKMKRLGWRPTISVEEGLRRMIACRKEDGYDDILTEATLASTVAA